MTLKKERNLVFLSYLFLSVEGEEVESISACIRNISDEGVKLQINKVIEPGLTVNLTVLGTKTIYEVFGKVIYAVPVEWTDEKEISLFDLGIQFTKILSGPS